MPGHPSPDPLGERPEWTLYPNCGGEEGGDWSRFSRFPGVWNCLRLWRFLFPAESVGAIGPVELPDVFWPAEIEKAPAHAAFRWIDQQPGAHPWWGDTYAQAAFKQAKVPWTGPDPHQARHVHDKAFAVEAGRKLGFEANSLRGLSEIFSPEALEEPDKFIQTVQSRIRNWPVWLDAFTLKPRLGSSGRGRIAGTRSDFNQDTLCRGLPRMKQRGGAILEPWLSRQHDLSVALHLSTDRPGSPSAVTLLGSLESIMHPSGLPMGHFGEMDSRGRVFSGSPFDEDIREAAVALAQAAHDAGYTGPCGVDAFTFTRQEDGEARETLRPIVEFNARYTLGLLAVGVLRRLLEWVKATLALTPGERIAFFVGLEPPEGLESWMAPASPSSSKIVGIALSPSEANSRPPGPGVLLSRDRSALAALVGAPSSPN